MDGDSSGNNLAAVQTGAVVSGNYFEWEIGQGGIYVQDTYPQSAGVSHIAITGNTFFSAAGTEADARLAILYNGVESAALIADNTLITYWNRVLTTDGSGNVWIPDVLDEAFTNSTTTVDALRYSGRLHMGSGVAYCTVTAGGTGFTAPPTISFSGGGGSGAAAIASIHRPTGALTGIQMTNRGSGYTSNPTVTITGTGSGATANATAAVNYGIMDNRRLSLVTLQAQSFTHAGSPNIVDGSGGTTIDRLANQTITLR